MKVIAFGLWGTTSRYQVGAVCNATLARDLYPGWTARFYVHRSVSPSLKAQLAAAGAELREMDEPPDWTGLLWRYFAVEDPAVKVAIFRDCDSRLTLRERSAVDEWLASGRVLHVMRDHPSHAFPIMGGMWGVRCAQARFIPALLRAQSAASVYQMDQVLLARQVWPRLKHDCFQHDEFRGGHRFPLARAGDEFVGQIYDERGVPRAAHIRSLRAALKKVDPGAGPEALFG